MSRAKFLEVDERYVLDDNSFAISIGNRLIFGFELFLRATILFPGHVRRYPHGNESLKITLIHYR